MVVCIPDLSSNIRTVALDGPEQDGGAASIDPGSVEKAVPRNTTTPGEGNSGVWRNLVCITIFLTVPLVIVLIRYARTLRPYKQGGCRPPETDSVLYSDETATQLKYELNVYANCLYSFRSGIDKPEYTEWSAAARERVQRIKYSGGACIGDVCDCLVTATELVCSEEELLNTTLNRELAGFERDTKYDERISWDCSRALTYIDIRYNTFAGLPRVHVEGRVTNYESGLLYDSASIHSRWKGMECRLPQQPPGYAGIQYPDSPSSGVFNRGNTYSNEWQGRMMDANKAYQVFITHQWKADAYPVGYTKYETKVGQFGDVSVTIQRHTGKDGHLVEVIKDGSSCAVEGVSASATVEKVVDVGDVIAVGCSTKTDSCDCSIPNWCVCTWQGRNFWGIGNKFDFKMIHSPMDRVKIGEV